MVTLGKELQSLERAMSLVHYRHIVHVFATKLLGFIGC